MNGKNAIIIYEIVRRYLVLEAHLAILSSGPLSTCTVVVSFHESENMKGINAFSNSKEDLFAFSRKKINALTFQV